MAETKITVSLSLDPEVVERVDRVARDETNNQFFDRSRSSIVEQIIRKALPNGKKKSRR